MWFSNMCKSRRDASAWSFQFFTDRVRHTSVCVYIYIYIHYIYIYIYISYIYIYRYTHKHI